MDTQEKNMGGMGRRRWMVAIVPDLSRLWHLLLWPAWMELRWRCWLAAAYLARLSRGDFSLVFALSAALQSAALHYGVRYATSFTANNLVFFLLLGPRPFQSLGQNTDKLSDLSA